MGKAAAAVLLLVSLAFASTPQSTMVLSSVHYAMSAFCKSLVSLLPVAAMMMIVLAGVIYAAGQMMGAETRARANVWATAALTGALIGILIYVVAPAVIGMMLYPDNPEQIKLNCQ
ncbi:MAG: hypothetical protein N3E51_02435 [Candidatus Micrarchaeota archaeon]|nr:hypothetical protein [Candidatus Micrarchaeota archaeon]